jgi:hypothetical protein
MNNIVIEQCLHGYDEGHSLIESSLKLPKETRSLILRMSDSSSVGYTESSQTYLTGYPLPEIGAYALARTWPAKNMTRPGCVWTQTLIIGFESLALFKNLAVLDQIFKDPNEQNVFEFYNKSLKLSESIHETTCDKGPKELVNTLLYSLYMTNKQHLLLPAHEDVELAVLNIWSKQWPKFRRNFKFRTYTNKSNSLNKFFDICFYDSSKTDFIDSPMISNEEQLILNILLDDIFEFSNDGLKDFLWRYGADSKELRGCYIPLVKIYYQLSKVNNVSDKGLFISDILNELFKYNNLSNSLETYLFSLALQYGDENLSNEVTDYILGKLIDIKSTAFVNNIMEITKFISKLSINQANEILINKIDNSEIAESLVVNLSNETLLNFALNFPDFIPKIIIFKPLFLLETDILREINNSPELISCINFTKNNLIKEIILKCIHLELWNIIFSIVEKYNSRIVHIIFKALDEISFSKKNLFVKKVLIKQPKLIKEALISGSLIPMHVLLTIVENIEVDAFSQEKIDPWLIALGKIEAKNQSLPEELALFLVLRGIRNLGSHPHLLLQASFDSLNQLIATSKISTIAWYKLDSALPHNNYHFWEYWDRCKKLRNGVIETYIDNNMPVEDFIYITNDKQTLAFLLTELECSRKSKYFLRDMLKFIIKKEIDIDSDFTKERQNKFNLALKK